MDCPACDLPGKDLQGWKVTVDKVPGAQIRCPRCQWSTVGAIHNGYLVPIGYRESNRTEGGADASTQDQAESGPAR